MELTRAPASTRPEPLDLPNTLFMALFHAGALLALVTGVGAADLVVCAGLYGVRMFGITGGYHRYFSHRSFKTSRVFQFVLAWLGATAMQGSPLWWAANHRDHHRYSDRPEDVHSPVQQGFWYAHVGWLLRKQVPRYELLRDFKRQPELWLLSRWHWVPFLTTVVVPLWLWGGPRAVVWGGLVSTVLLWHGIFTINSLAHIRGTQRYATGDTSRNNWLVVALTLGEGWHNNHHHYARAARHGFAPGELDVTYGILRALAALGLVWDLRQPTEAVLRQGGVIQDSRAARPGDASATDDHSASAHKR